MTRYFITVTYRNWLAPINGRWQNSTGLQTCNGFIVNMHPVEWLAKQHDRARKAWDGGIDHTSFQEILFYDLLNDYVNVDNLQDLS